jgi:hypothetical protein
MVDNRIVVGSLALLMTACGMALMYMVLLEKPLLVKVKADPENLIRGEFPKKAASGE